MTKTMQKYSFEQSLSQYVSYQKCCDCDYDNDYDEGKFDTKLVLEAQSLERNFQKNENWRNWKMSFVQAAILNFFLPPNFFFSFFLMQKICFIKGIIFFSTLDGFFRILENNLYVLCCTRLYVPVNSKTLECVKTFDRLQSCQLILKLKICIPV